MECVFGLLSVCEWCWQPICESETKLARIGHRPIHFEYSCFACRGSAMPILLKCPNCFDKVSAQESDRGRRIKCGTCWADVSVPKASPDSPAVVKPVASKRPVVKAQPHVAKPVQPENQTKKKPRYQSEDDIDELDDAPPIRTTTRGGSKWVMIAFIGLAAVILIGGISTIVVLFSVNRSNDSAAANDPGLPPPAQAGNEINPAPANEKPDWKPIPDAAQAKQPGRGRPGANFQPVPVDQELQPIVGDDQEPIARRRPQANELKPVDIVWKPIENKGGFACEAPPNHQQETTSIDLDGKVLLRGTKYTAEDEHCQYIIQHFDLPTDNAPSAEKVFQFILRDLHLFKLNGSEEIKLGDRAATKWQIQHRVGGSTAGYTVKVDYRLFVAFVIRRNHQPIEAELEGIVRERQKKFFDTLRFHFDPKIDKPYAHEPEWVTMAKTVGFTVSIPRQATSEDEFRPFFGIDAQPGRVYKAEVDGITYEAFRIDLPIAKGKPAEPNKTMADVVKSFTDHEHIQSGPETVKMGGQPAEQYKLRANGRQPAWLRVAQIGRTVFALKTSGGWDRSTSPGDKEYADKSVKFLDSFAVGSAPAGGEAGAAKTAAGPFTQIAVGKVKPFWAATFLPVANELITVGVRDPNATPAGGVLRRYSLPDFQLKATYSMNFPGHRIAADERLGKLYVATVSGAADAKMSERDAAIVSGEIQLFDLKKLLDGTIAELEQLKAATSWSIGGTSFQLSGLKLSASGDAVYVSCIQNAGSKAKPSLRGKLIKFDPATNKPTELACEGPIWAMDLSADGQQMAVLERSTVPGRNGSLVFIDVPAWKRLRSVPLAGDPLDVAFVGTQPFIVETVNGAAKLTTFDSDREAIRLALLGEVRYLRALPNGQGVLTSTGMFTSEPTASGVTALLTGDLAKPLQWAPKALSTDTGGMITISPDGKLAVLNLGNVFELPK
jgi:hypothetical protein